MVYEDGGLSNSLPQLTQKLESSDIDALQFTHFLICVTITSIQSVDASTTMADGQRDGKAQGNIDAMNGYPADDRCGPGHTNDYCAAYKIAYNVEYYWILHHIVLIL